MGAAVAQVVDIQHEMTARHSYTQIGAATPAMDEATQLCFWFPAVGRKKVTAAFDGGRITSDGSWTLQ
jgi:hypothetical protein